MERAAFLDGLRRRLTVPAPENLPHPIPAFTTVPEVRFAQDLSDARAAFLQSAAAHGAAVRAVGDADALDALIGEVVAAHAVKTAVLSKDPEASAASVALQQHGVELLDFDGPASAARAGLGVTGATWGIAGTGSLLVDATRAGGRSASLLPPVHLALIAASRIVRTHADVWRHMGERYPDGPPSQMVLITGPSRTGDIELVLTLGVHGPGALWIGVLDGE